MAELKTKKTALSVETFVKSIKDELQRNDCMTVIDLMKKATKSQPKMWGSAVIGFGDRHLIYDSGRELDWFVIGFSPRKAALTFYAMGAAEAELLNKLGKHTTGKGCLYIKRLADVNIAVLKKIIDSAVKRHSAD